MRVELTASELGEIHAGKRIKRFACTPEDPCDILGIEFSDGTAVVFAAHFEEKAKRGAFVAGKAPIYVRGEKTQREV